MGPNQIFVSFTRGFNNFSVSFPSTNFSDNDIFVIQCVPLALDMNNVQDVVVAAIIHLLSVRESIEVTVTIHNLVVTIDDANQFDGKHFAADENIKKKKKTIKSNFENQVRDDGFTSGSLAKINISMNGFDSSLELLST